MRRFERLPLRLAHRTARRDMGPCPFCSIDFASRPALRIPRGAVLGSRAIVAREKTMPGLLSRRYLLKSATALAAMSALDRTVQAAPSSASGATALPARGTFVIRSAFVMTMDDAGDIANADVHVANGAIVAVGQNLK